MLGSLDLLLLLDFEESFDGPLMFTTALLVALSAVPVLESDAEAVEEGASEDVVEEADEQHAVVSNSIPAALTACQRHPYVTHWNRRCQRSHPLPHNLPPLRQSRRPPRSPLRRLCRPLPLDGEGRAGEGTGDIE